jgi:hypothetical protein
MNEFKVASQAANDNGVEKYQQQHHAAVSNKHLFSTYVYISIDFTNIIIINPVVFRRMVVRATAAGDECQTKRFFAYCWIQ